MRKKQEKTKQVKGITLIALVITIIILLILSGVVINLTLGERGILNMAKQAGEEYKRTAAQEKVTLALIDYEARTNTTNMTEEQKKTTLLDTLNSVGTTTEEEDHYKVIVDGYEFWVDKDTLEVESKGGTSTGNPTVPEESKLPEGLEIGSTVTYNPSGTYDWKAEYACSIESSYSEHCVGTLESSTGKKYNISSWKVFEIDEKAEKVTLVPANLPNSYVALNGPQRI